MDVKNTNYSSETDINIGCKSNKDQGKPIEAHQKQLMVSVQRKTKG